jgi:hypothetical protein
MSELAKTAFSAQKGEHFKGRLSRKSISSQPLRMTKGERARVNGFWDVIDREKNRSCFTRCVITPGECCMKNATDSSVHSARAGFLLLAP